MALANFIKPGSYSRITQIRILKEIGVIDFEVSVYESDGGPLLLNPLPFSISKDEAKAKYIEENVIYPTKPEYPTICAERDEMVPMWTDESTPGEIDGYNTAKAQFVRAITNYETLRAEKEAAGDLESETKSEYSSFFSDQQIYKDSNPTACAYAFLKAQPGFEGVVDA